MSHPRAFEAILHTWQRAEGSKQPLHIRVSGWSMAPLLHPGDTVIVEPIATTQLRRGDLIVVGAGGALLTHRIVRVGPSELLLRGDAQATLDPPLAPSALVGLVVARQRSKQRLELCGGLWAPLNSVLGWLGAAGASQPQAPLRQRVRAKGARLAAHILLATVLALTTGRPSQQMNKKEHGHA